MLQSSFLGSGYTASLPELTPKPPQSETTGFGSIYSNRITLVCKYMHVWRYQTLSTQTEQARNTCIRELRDDPQLSQTGAQTGHGEETVRVGKHSSNWRRLRQSAGTHVVNAVGLRRRRRQHGDSTKSAVRVVRTTDARRRSLGALWRPLDDTHLPWPPPPTAAAAAAAAARQLTPTSASFCSVDSGTRFSLESRSVATPAPARHARVLTGNAAGWNDVQAQIPEENQSRDLTPTVVSLNHICDGKLRHKVKSII